MDHIATLMYLLKDKVNGTSCIDINEINRTLIGYQLGTFGHSIRKRATNLIKVYPHTKITKEEKILVTY